MSRQPTPKPIRPIYGWARLCWDGTGVAHGWSDIESKYGGLRLHAQIYRTRADAAREHLTTEGSLHRIVRVVIREVARQEKRR